MKQHSTVVDNGRAAIMEQIIKIAERNLLNVEYNILREVLVENNSLGNIPAMSDRSINNQREVFNFAVQRLIQVLEDGTPPKNPIAEFTKELREVKGRLDRLEHEARKPKYVPQLSKKVRAALSKRIDATELSARIKTICAQNEIVTVGQLASMPKFHFLQLRNCGNGAYEEANSYLISKGLNWDTIPMPQVST